ncbi:hypothetical protein HG537_0B00520 [Torulaspora globosa]|uniref:WD40 repeat-like protein n=1 Tax=Torulaspora globosa TaxID=48254 RepID=A0A7H9HN41_9SACH|nr:hypothetical protein HG537_0B00520 [Torulaspora sp. CBS 2947]
MPLTFGSPLDSETSEVFMPLYTGKRKRTRTVAGNGKSSLSGPSEQDNLDMFDREQLVKLLIHALKELGYNISAQALQAETGGIQVESTVVQKLFNIIRRGNFESITLELLSQLPLKYGSLGLKDVIEDLQLGSDLSPHIKDEDSMKIGNVVSESADWKKVVDQMEQQLKTFENFVPSSGRSFSSQTLLQLTTLVEVMVLINKEIFLELLFDQRDSHMAVAFLRNCLRKFIEIWDSLLALRNDILDEDAPFTPEKLLKDMTTILTSPETSILQSSTWQGSAAKSRDLLIEEISNYINPNDLVPRNRLLTLLKQAIKYQRSQDVLYISDDGDNLIMDDEEEGERNNGLFNHKFNLLQDNSSNFQQIKFTEEKTLVQNADEIWFLQFSPNGRYLASATADSLTDRKIMIYDVQNDFQVYKVLAGIDLCVLYLSFSPDSRYIVSCPFNKKANIYDIHSKGEPTFINPTVEGGIVAEIIQPMDSFQIPAGPSSTSNNSSEPPRIWCCDWFHTPEHEGRFIVGSPDREVVVYDLKSKTILMKLSSSICTSSNGITNVSQGTAEQFPRVHDLKITADDKYLILMPHQGNIDVYDLSDFPNNEKIEKNEVAIDKVVLPRVSRFNIPNRMTCISLPQVKDSNSPLASLMLVSLKSNELQLWDFHEQILIQKYFGQKQEQFIIRSCFGYNDKLIASGSEDGKIYIWDRINGNIIGVLTAHVAERPATSGNNKKPTKTCNTVVWSPTDKKLFASGGDDGYIKIWRVEKE